MKERFKTDILNACNEREVTLDGRAIDNSTDGKPIAKTEKEKPAPLSQLADPPVSQTLQWNSDGSRKKRPGVDYLTY